MGAPAEGPMDARGSPWLRDGRWRPRGTLPEVLKTRDLARHLPGHGTAPEIAPS